MADKPSYSMSSIGGCLRSIAAKRQGYEERSSPEFLRTAAKEGNRHEAWVQEDLEEQGYEVSDAGLCEPCGRNGHHVEMEFPAFKLVGHMDRIAEKDGQRFLVEIKALGKFRAEPLVKAVPNGFPGFREYACQVSAYHYATGLPILYAVKNRDSGKLSLFKIEPPVELEEIVDYILGAELASRRGELPACTMAKEEFWYRFCPFSYLHEGSADTDSMFTVSSAVSQDVQVISRYLKAKSRKELAEIEMKREMDQFILPAARKGGGSTVTLEDGKQVKVSYTKPKSKRISYPKEAVERVVPEEYLVQCRDSKPPASDYAKVEEVV